MYLVIWWRWEVCVDVAPKVMRIRMCQRQRRRAQRRKGGGEVKREKHENTDNFTHKFLSSLLHMATRRINDFIQLIVIDTGIWRIRETGENALLHSTRIYIYMYVWTIRVDFGAKRFFLSLVFMMWLHVVILHGVWVKPATRNSIWFRVRLWLRCFGEWMKQFFWSFLALATIRSEKKEERKK